MSQNIGQEMPGVNTVYIGAGEETERVRSRIRQIMELSEDPEYDRFLAQMKKDLESGKATPAQVEGVLENSYRQYRQRMDQMPAQQMQTQNTTAGGQMVSRTQEEVPGKTIEFKIGVHLFGIVGAIFILAALVSLSYNFMNGMGQGICLYAAALALVAVSELYVYKRLPAFAAVLTGIGIGSLYVANIANYYALHTINEIAAMIVTAVIAAGTLLLGRKKNSVSVRLISLTGCYICFFFMGGFATELNLLMTSAIVLIVNVASLFLKTEKNGTAVDSVHIWTNLIFTIFILSAAASCEVQIIYRLFFAVTAFTFTEILALLRCRQKNTLIFIFSAVANGMLLLWFAAAVTMGSGTEDNPVFSLILHFVAAALVLAVSATVYLLWNKEDGRKWAQAYYALLTILVIGTLSGYFTLEAILTALAVFWATKLLPAKKELQVLDCTVTIYFVVMGLSYVEKWYVWLFMGALLLSVFRIRQKHRFHEITVTVGILLMWMNWYTAADYGKTFGFSDELMIPASILILLGLFLLFNHLPLLKRKPQKAVNITLAVFMGFYCLTAGACRNYWYTVATMVIAAAAILIMFRKRYELEIPGKSLLLAGVQVYLLLMGNFGTPIVASVLLMVIAFYCVGIGFRHRDKAERICGLVLAGLVCLKLVLYDFREVGMLYRAIVFLAVGVIALLISFFYIVLEKKETRKEEKEKEKEKEEAMQSVMAAQQIPAGTQKENG